MYIKHIAKNVYHEDPLLLTIVSQGYGLCKGSIFYN